VAFSELHPQGEQLCFDHRRYVQHYGTLLVAGRLGPSQLADSLQWLAYALIVVFLALFLTALFPIALLEPEWILRVSAALREASSLALIALGLIMLANTLDSMVMPSRQHLGFFRRIATIAAIGFLLLIPLQTYGAVSSIQSQLRESKSQLNRLLATSNLVKSASNEQQLRDAIRLLPGGEELAFRPLGGDVQTIKNVLLERLSASTNLLQNQLKETQRTSFDQAIKPLIRDAVIALAYAIGFASMGYNRFGQPTPLRRLLKSRSPQLFKDQGDSAESSFNTPWP
jgi:hypothetical protein